MSPAPRRRGGSVGWRPGRVALLLLSALAGAMPLASQATPAPSRRGVPAAPGSELTIAVLTMGVGAAVWERFGHNAIVVEDRLRGTSTTYNYGMFSFRQENFLLRFIQGRMTYWMATDDLAAEVRKYTYFRRSLWRQELNLSPAERAAFRDFLEWNALPEHRNYRYDYYLDNCSTRVRDAIDRILGGALRAQMQGPAGGSFRFHTQRLNTHNPALYTGLLLALGEGADRPVTRWDEMFLPLKLREHLRDVRIPDSAGRLVPLVLREDTLYQSSAYAVPDAPPRWMPWYLLIGCCLGGSFLWGWRGTGRGRGVARGAGTAWALVTGLAGAVLAGLWGLTDHAIAARNENVLQLSVVALALGVLLLFGRPDRPGVLRAIRALALVVGGLSLLGLLLQVLPQFDQVNGQVLALTVPANLGLALALGLRPRGRVG